MLILIIVASLFYCFILVLTFSLLRAGRKADEAEERILRIIQSEFKDNKENLTQKINSHAQILA